MTCCTGYTLTVTDTKFPNSTLERIGTLWREGVLCHDCYYKATAEYMAVAWPPLNNAQRRFIS